jgi:F0F1-type ATP synthase membrane subunit b/b'
MAQLGAEIESLRASGRQELAAEGERIRKETADSIAKVQSSAAAEIESATKAARQELKIFSAQLAVDLAEQRIRGRVAGGESALVDKFIRNLETTKGANN